MRSTRLHYHPRCTFTFLVVITTEDRILEGLKAAQIVSLVPPYAIRIDVNGRPTYRAALALYVKTHLFHYGLWQ